MRIEIFYSDTVSELNKKVLDWATEFNPEITETSFQPRQQNSDYYYLTVTYSLSEEQKKKVDMVSSFKSEATE